MCARGKPRLVLLVICLQVSPEAARRGPPGLRAEPGARPWCHKLATSPARPFHLRDLQASGQGAWRDLSQRQGQAEPPGPCPGLRSPPGIHRARRDGPDGSVRQTLAGPPPGRAVRCTNSSLSPAKGGNWARGGKGQRRSGEEMTPGCAFDGSSLAQGRGVPSRMANQHGVFGDPRSPKTQESSEQPAQALEWAGLAWTLHSPRAGCVSADKSASPAKPRCPVHKIESIVIHFWGVIVKTK